MHVSKRQNCFLIDVYEKTCYAESIKFITGDYLQENLTLQLGANI